LNNYFSLGLDVGTFRLWYPCLEIYSKWYPWKKLFYIGAGLGAWYYTHENHLFFLTSLEIGFKINISNNWVLIPYLAGRYIPEFLGAYFFPFPFLGVKFGYKF